MDDSLYLTTLERLVRRKIENIAIVSLKVCFLDYSQLDKFMKHVCVPVSPVKGNSTHSR